MARLSSRSKRLQYKKGLKIQNYRAFSAVSNRRRIARSRVSFPVMLFMAALTAA